MSIKKKVGEKKTYAIVKPDEIPTNFSHIYNDSLSRIQDVFVHDRSILCQLSISKTVLMNDLHLLDYGALP